jgi:hypothetical protein
MIVSRQYLQEQGILGFFKMFKKPKTDIRLQLEKTTLALGANTNGAIIISAKEEYDTTEIRAELRCVERIRRETWVYNNRLRRNIRHVYWDSASLLSEDLKVSGLIHIIPGFEKKFPFKLSIPASGRETLDGIDSNVSWFIKGVVAVEGRPDATSDTIELQIIRSKITTKEEVEMVQCEYCRALIPVTSSLCPVCGAPRKS